MGNNAKEAKTQLINTETSNDGWTKVERGGDAWDFDANPELIGVYVENRTGLKNERGEELNMHMVRVANGEKFGVWGTAVTNDRFAEINIGEEVKVVFTEMAETKDGERTYRKFDVYHRQVA